MFDKISRLIHLFIKVLGIATAQVAIQELDKVAYSRYDARSRFGYKPYSGPTRDVFEKRQFNDYPKPRTRKQAVMRVGQAVREANELNENPGSAVWRERSRIGRIRSEQEAAGFYHDVLMVAFDITGPNQAVVQEWLANHMPPARGYVKHDVNVDAWWIADDEADGDCDSAVFVAKGKQAEARALLREHGLTY